MCPPVIIPAALAIGSMAAATAVSVASSKKAAQAQTQAQAQVAQAKAEAVLPQINQLVLMVLIIYHQKLL